jgi:hypothetical protein
MSVTLVQSTDNKIEMPIGSQLGNLLNPFSTERMADFYIFTPSLARWILEYHNEDNRPISTLQVNVIKKNIKDVGILYDGYPVTINTEGNLTEKQHFLTWLSTQPEDTEVELLVTTGVGVDTFSKAAAAVPRTYASEIWRKYGEEEAPKKQISALADLIKRKKSSKDMTINNAVSYWNDWYYDIKASWVLSKSFRENTRKFRSFEKTVNAWATFCVRYRLEDYCEIVLKLLEDEILHVGSGTVLTSQALDVWNGAEKASTNGLSNDKRMNIVFGMLCKLTDAVKTNPLGNKEFDYNITDLQDKDMSGCYKLFINDKD